MPHLFFLLVIFVALKRVPPSLHNTAKNEVEIKYIIIIRKSTLVLLFVVLFVVMLVNLTIPSKNIE